MGRSWAVGKGEAFGDVGWSGHWPREHAGAFDDEGIHAGGLQEQEVLQEKAQG